MSQRTCIICGEPHFGRGYCRFHYGRWWRTGDPLADGAPEIRSEDKGCAFIAENGERCPNAHAGRGYCLGHYQQLKAGKELTPLQVKTFWNGAKCSVVEDGKPCDGDATSRGMCGKHYQRWAKGGDPAVKPERPKKIPAKCSECDEPVHSHGYCSSHDARWRKYGDPNFVPPPRQRATCVAIEDGQICGRPVQGNGYCSKHNTRWKKHGDPSVVTPRHGSGYRKWTLDESYFDEIDTPEKAYWLGFLAADGSITGNDVHGWGLSLELADRDATHVHKFAGAMETDSPVFESGQHCVRLRLNSQYLVQSLAVLGITPRKSGIVVPPLESLVGLEAFYWRGLWDGDGHVVGRKDRGAGWSIGICGSLACVEGFTSWARQISGGTARIVNDPPKSPDFWKWAVGGTRGVQLLAEQLLLAGPGFGLDRKQVLLEAICNFDLDAYKIQLGIEHGAKMREAWASGRHARSKRPA